MQAELVWSQGARNRRMHTHFNLKSVHVANVVDTLLELTNVARCQAHPVDAQAPQLCRDVDMLCGSGWRLRLVDRDLNLPIPSRCSLRQVPVQQRHIGDGSPVLDGGTRESEFVETDEVFLATNGSREISCLEGCRAIFQLLPW